MRISLLPFLALMLSACAADNRTMGTQVDDKAIEIQARAYVTGAEEVKDRVHIVVTSVNGMVLLTGEADSIEMRDRVLAELRTYANVRRIVNEIRIAPPSSFGERSGDTWLAAKVKSRLRGETKSGRLEVVATNRSVYLLGLLSRDDADKATELARRVDGVERVVRLFEYLE